MVRSSIRVLVVAVVLSLLAAVPALARVDYSGPAYNILAPGEFGGLPTNQYSTDQAQLYDALTPLAGHVTPSDLSKYYLSEKFGITGPVVRREQTGRPGLQILRDKNDIPHIYGTTRDDVMFGSGWVAAEDRQLLLLEGLGPAYLATLDAPGINPFGLVTSGQSFTPSAQTIQFVASQENVLRRAGSKGLQVLRDLQDWIDGINAYADTQPNRANLPHAKLTDAIAGFAFIGSIFGNGGGAEVSNSDFLARLRQRLGTAAAPRCSTTSARSTTPRRRRRSTSHSRTTRSRPGRRRARWSSTPGPRRAHRPPQTRRPSPRTATPRTSSSPVTATRATDTRSP